MRDLPAVFEEIYQKERWGKGKGSGTGSSPTYCELWLRHLKKAIPTGATVLDIGCGDMQVWKGSEKTLRGWNYTGVEASATAFSMAKSRFPDLTLINEPLSEKLLDSVDVPEYILLKDVIQHWSDEEIAINVPLIVNKFPKAAIYTVNNWRYFRTPKREVMPRCLDRYSWAPVPLDHPTLVECGFQEMFKYPRGNYKQVMRRN